MKNIKSLLKMRWHKVRITTWVAMVIIAAIAIMTGIYVWTQATDSWVYEDTSTRYPRLRETITQVVTAISTVGWQTYRDEGYGFEVRYPAKYQATIGKVVGSVLGTLKTPVFGASVGPLVFVKTDTAKLKSAAEAKFESYWSSDDCIKKTVNTGFNVRLALCIIDGAAINYGLAKGKDFDIFVDGYTGGYDQELLKTYGSPGKTVSQGEMLTILSSFRFTGLEAEEQVPCVQAITRARDPKTDKIQEFPTPCDVPEGWITNLLE